MRVFVAIDLPEAERRALGQARARMQREVRGVGPKWVDPTQLHATLKFLGELDDAVEGDLVSMVRGVAADASTFETTLERVMTLGPPRKARVIVASLTDPAGHFAALAARLDREALRFGVQAESRRFTPHVTVARLKVPHDPSAYLAHAALEPTSFWCRELVLYRSELRPSGATYHALCRAALSGT